MLEQALSNVKESLAADGYILTASQQEEGIIDIVIEAGPEACPDCLSPKFILESVIGKALTENNVAYKKINITLPHN
jgi:hypothetical protein